MASTTTQTVAPSAPKQTTFTTTVFVFLSEVDNFVTWLNESFNPELSAHREMCLHRLNILNRDNKQSLLPFYKGVPTTVLKSLAKKRAHDLMITASRLGFVHPSDVEVVRRLPLSKAGQSVLLFNCFSVMSQRCVDTDSYNRDNINYLIEYHNMCEDMREYVRKLESQLKQEKARFELLRSRYDVMSKSVRTSSQADKKVTSTVPTKSNKPATSLKRDRDFNKSTSIPDMAERLVVKSQMNGESFKRARQKE
jgi:predicted O-linked N-acetylglucosamine transferase (SPINDLY family)